ncbi:MAG: glycosyltransferase [Proteobacteria bacterium]|nr:glycosyltransferase [Pseudomonadota bacterium]
MSIIFNLVQSNTNGGMENVFMDYARIINKSKHQLFCLTSSNFPQNYILDQEQITRITLNIKGHFDIVAAIKLFLLIKKHKPALIIAHNGRAFAALNLAKKLFPINTPILAISHGGNPKRLLKFDYVASVAKHITDNIINKGFKGKAVTIYNGIKIAQFTKRRTANKAFTFGMMSRLSPEKNIEIALKAFAKFIQQTNQNSQLIIAGEGKEKENLVELSKALNITDKVQFVGWTNDLGAFFNEIDVFIQSSLNEPFGLTILEGFNHYTPVIAANVCGPKEIIKNGTSGFLFDADKKDDLLIQMQYVFNNQQELPKVAKNAHDSLMADFSYEKMSQSLSALINQIVKPRS